MVKTIHVCVVGAGPSGMSLLYHTKKLQVELKSEDIFQVTCFEKQGDWGGQWNYTWRIGTDEHGEQVHSSMYTNLWINTPKEANIELPHYTFEEHFGKPVGSFPPRPVIYDYFKGLWTKHDLRKDIKFKHSVKSVSFNGQVFDVTVKDLLQDSMLPALQFDYFVDCSGHFATPNVPYFDGIETFPGLVLHSHDVKHAENFKGQRLLLIGAFFSGEDLAIQTIKLGAKSAILSHRTRALGSNFPQGIEERPLVTSISKKKISFNDGTSAEVDAIIMCTGYLHNYPYLEDNLRLRGENVLCPLNLYKGVLWLDGGGNHMMYLGTQAQLYSAKMFDVQARWAAKYMAQQIKIPPLEKCLEENKKDRDSASKLANLYEMIDYQSDYVITLAKECSYGFEIDTRKLFKDNLDDKIRDMKTYRDKGFHSIHTRNKTPVHHTKWWDATDDSLENFVC